MEQENQEVSGDEPESDPEDEDVEDVESATNGIDEKQFLLELRYKFCSMTYSH